MTRWIVLGLAPLAACAPEPVYAPYPAPIYPAPSPYSAGPLPLAPPPLTPPVVAEPIPPPAPEPEPAPPPAADQGLTLPDGTVLIPPATDASPAPAAGPSDPALTVITPDTPPAPAPAPAPAPVPDSSASVPFMGFRPMKGQTKPGL